MKIPQWWHIIQAEPHREDQVPGIGKDRHASTVGSCIAAFIAGHDVRGRGAASRPPVARRPLASEHPTDLVTTSEDLVQVCRLRFAGQPLIEVGHGRLQQNAGFFSLISIGKEFGQ